MAVTGIIASNTEPSAIAGTSVKRATHIRNQRQRPLAQRQRPTRHQWHPIHRHRLQNRHLRKRTLRCKVPLQTPARNCRGHNHARHQPHPHRQLPHPHLPHAQLPHPHLRRPCLRSPNRLLRQRQQTRRAATALSPPFPARPPAQQTRRRPLFHLAGPINRTPARRTIQLQRRITRIRIHNRIRHPRHLRLPPRRPRSQPWMRHHLPAASNPARCRLC
jgi:hypothetical protein